MTNRIDDVISLVNQLAGVVRKMQDNMRKMYNLYIDLRDRVERLEQESQ